MRSPAIGPNIAANRASTADERFRFVFGIPEGTATKRMSTNMMAAPIPTATTVLIESFLFPISSSLRI
jgi:hypothetical protein